MTPQELRLVQQKVSLGPGVLKLNETEPTELRTSYVSPRTPRSAISTMEERLNKTERRFLNRLRRGEVSIAGPFDSLGIQEITLRLGFDLRYTADVHTSWAGMVTLWEVKGGFEREDAAVKIKMAAAKFPFFRFIKSVWKDGQWTDTVVRP